MTSSPILFNDERLTLIIDTRDSDYIGVHSFTMYIDNQMIDEGDYKYFTRDFKIEFLSGLGGPPSY